MTRFAVNGLLLFMICAVASCGANAGAVAVVAIEDGVVVPADVEVAAASEISSEDSGDAGAAEAGSIAADAPAGDAPTPDAPALDLTETTPDSAEPPADTAVADTAPTCGTATCGDGKCTPSCEKHSTCPQDCPVTCGDGECSGGENPKDCAEDCCGSCGDGKCIAYACGEQDPTSKNYCAKDCGIACGDGKCTAGETPANCAQDCAIKACGNHQCEVGETPQNCKADCGTTCGNCLCEKGESYDDCPIDCGFCGDGVCSPCKDATGLAVESTPTCQKDCEFSECNPAFKGKQCGDDDVCTDDSCSALGKCVHVANSADCSDGNACTSADACAGGVCMGGKAPDCVDGNPCTKDLCDATMGCAHPAEEKGVVCDDGNACTAGEVCLNAVCTGGNVIACDDGNVCTDNKCAPLSGCVYPAIAGACDDLDACTSGDVCGDGKCKGLNGLDCSDGNPCTDDSCDKLNGCVNVANAAACDDLSVCTKGDVCAGGQCGGKVIDCDDKNACTDDNCDKIKGCSHSNNILPCSDGDVCTDNDLCAGGACKGNYICCKINGDCDDKNVCTLDVCLPSQVCGHNNKPDGSGCDDGSVCTAPDACKTGTCVGTPSLNCDDGNACTDDSCDPIAGCKNAANIAGCDDGNPCTAPDACAAKSCKGAAIKDGSGCSDGNACTAFDGCKAGVCIGVPIDVASLCDDNNLCTVDSCVPVSGCKSVALTCDDQNDCTTDSCDKVKGCAHVAVADNAPCNQSYCKAGACVCEEQYVAIDVDDAGVKKLVCAPDYPVWGIEADSPVGIYKDNGNGTVADTLTGRTWQQAVPTVACGGQPTCDWAGAKIYCDQLVLAGKADWRLPTVTELASLIDIDKFSPAVNASVFPGVLNYQLTWAATKSSASDSVAWCVVFGNGNVFYGDISNGYTVRCVR